MCQTPSALMQQEQFSRKKVKGETPTDLTFLYVMK